MYRIISKSQIVGRSCFKYSVRYSSHTTVGFIGLGQMGCHMAANLVKHDHHVVAYDISEKCSERLKAVVSGSGSLDIVNTPAEVAAADNVNTIITMLPSSPQSLEVYCGHNGILGSVKEGTLLLDSTTGSPEVSRELSAKAYEKGAHYMDTPVSGGILAARDGILTFMVGGNRDHMGRAKEILSLMGKNIVYCGEVGNGEAAKICNNLLLAISMIGTAETFQLGEAMGIKPKTLARVVNSSSGRCWSSELYNPVPGLVEGVPSSRDYHGGFVCKLMAKDLGLALEVANASRTNTPLGASATQLYQLLVSQGYGNLDFSVVYQFLRDRKQEML